jgi:hypothetical protein
MVRGRDVTYLTPRSAPRQRSHSLSQRAIGQRFGRARERTASRWREEKAFFLNWLRVPPRGGLHIHLHSGNVQPTLAQQLQQAGRQEPKARRCGAVVGKKNNLPLLVIGDRARSPQGLG